MRKHAIEISRKKKSYDVLENFFLSIVIQKRVMLKRWQIEIVAQGC